MGGGDGIAAELRRQLDFNRAVLDSTDAYIAVMDRDGRVARANRAFEEAFGSAGGDAPDVRPFWDRFLRGEAVQRAAKRFADAFGGHTLDPFESTWYGRGGKRRLVHWTLAALRGDSGEIEHLVGTGVDVTERRRIEDRLAFLADNDPLTGLANRRRFEDEIDRQASQRRGRAHGAVIFLDLDNFKYLNDTLGHRAGDGVIKAIARVLRDQLGDRGLLARIGGDEFGLLLAGADLETAQSVADELLGAVRRYRLVVEESSAHVTMSAGIAMLDGGRSASDLLVAADAAMYEAKSAGRDKVFVAPSGQPVQLWVNTGFAWSERIRDALETDAFVLHCQPIFEVATGRSRHFELLLRMQDADGELIPPGVFLPFAERFGLIQAIDRWVVRRAIELSAQLQRRGEPLRLEVNLSGASIGHPEMLELISDELTRRSVDSAGLVFEITETVAIADLDAAARFARELMDRGCQFALDDFGTGYSSFFHLKHLPVNFLKIDGEFIRGLADSPTDRVLVQAMVQIARGLGVQTIAEFVGDEPTMQALAELGVDHGQGFHLGEPAPLDALRPLRRTPS